MIGDIAGPLWVKTTRSRASCEPETPIGWVPFLGYRGTRRKFFALKGAAGFAGAADSEREMSHLIR